MTKLLIFAGSTRQLSFNRQLVQVAAQLAQAQGAQVTLLELSTLNIPMYNADLKAQGKLQSDTHRKSVQAVADQVLWAAQRLSAWRAPHLRNSIFLYGLRGTCRTRHPS